MALHSDQFLQTLCVRCEVAKKTYRPINNLEALQGSNACADDAPAFAHASIASLIEGILAIAKQRYTWAIVKLYYSVFYSVRARMALNSEAVFYLGNSPFYIRCVSGNTFSKQRGNSHSILFRKFRSSFSADLLNSQPIDNVDALDWVEELRNESSYRTVPFPDPDPPECLKKISMNIRRNLSEFVDDQQYLYAFQPDYACLAYPVLAMRELDTDLRRSKSSVTLGAHFRNMLVEADCDVGAFSRLDAINLD